MSQRHKSWKRLCLSLDSLESTASVKYSRAGGLFGKWYQKVQVRIQNENSEEKQPIKDVLVKKIISISLILLGTLSSTYQTCTNGIWKAWELCLTLWSLISWSLVSCWERGVSKLTKISRNPLGKRVEKPEGERH